MPPPDHYMAQGWTHSLGEVEHGVPFLMFNYDGPYMRVHTTTDYRVSWPGRAEKPFDDDGYHVPIVCLADGHLFWMAKTKPVRFAAVASTWTFAQAQDWPGDLSVPEVPRRDVEILYSFGHYDGPATGLVRWRGEHWYVHRAERIRYDDDRFWLVKLTPEQQAYALGYGTRWAELFHSGMTWNPDGSRVPRKLGVHGRHEGCTMTCEPDAYRRFHAENRRPEPDTNAAVAGFFYNWHAGE